MACTKTMCSILSFWLQVIYLPFTVHFNFFNIVALQVIVIQYGDVFLETRPLSLKHWALSIGLGTSSLAIGVFARFIPIDKYFPKSSPKIEKKATEITPLLS
eukprot:Phypoly_transcript_24598.p1 GENE.Phypoly_transcript_24598~~Phypoly_transcript_24598.p1  ORF type:complete len:102 (+),score=5.41 Phypoly_transcript_24598:180-485(+)